MVRRNQLRIQTYFSYNHERKCKINNLGGKHILVGAPSLQETMDGSDALAIFGLFFNGSPHNEVRK
jgi:hypothetical protein